MPQYIKYKNNQYSSRTDLTSGLKWRFGRRSDAFVNDIELVVNGFSLAENTGWENVSSNYGPVMGEKIREGVRSANYVLDGEINTTGFDGTINVDWENYITA